MEFFVEGEPKGQPRPRVTVIAGRPRLYDGGSAEEWASAVRSATEREYRRQSVTALSTYAIELELDFAMPRPATHMGTGKNRGKLKPWAPHWHTKKPDIDNVVKLIMDQLHDLIYDDDKCVSHVRAKKFYTQEGEKPGCMIRIYLA